MAVALKPEKISVAELKCACAIFRFRLYQEQPMIRFDRCADGGQKASSKDYRSVCGIRNYGRRQQGRSTLGAEER